MAISTYLRLIIGSFILYAVYYAYWELTVGASRRRMIAKYGCKPIKPTNEWTSVTHPIFGWQSFKESTAAHRSHRLLEYLCNRFRRHGNTVSTKVLTTNFISTIEPENLKTILAVNFNHWENTKLRKQAFIPLLGPGIFSNDGVAWKHSRELLRPNFNRSQVHDLAMLETHIGHLVRAIPKDGSMINLQDLFFQLTIDSATELLFGESTNCLIANNERESEIARFVEAWDRAQTEMVDSARYGRWINYLRGSRLEKEAKVAHELVDMYVQRGLLYRKNLDLEKADMKSGERYIFLHELVKRTDDPVYIRSELLNILLAGRDTTASLLSNTWFVLANRPDVWAKLQEEVDRLGGKPPTFEQMRDMKYLKFVFSECGCFDFSTQNLNISD